MIGVAADDDAALVAGHGAHATVADQDDGFAANAHMRGTGLDYFAAMRRRIANSDYVCHE